MIDSYTLSLDYKLQCSKMAQVIVTRFRKERYYLAQANVPEAERCRIFEAFDSSEVVGEI